MRSSHIAAVRREDDNLIDSQLLGDLGRVERLDLADSG